MLFWWILLFYFWWTRSVSNIQCLALCSLLYSVDSFGQLCVTVVWVDIGTMMDLDDFGNLSCQMFQMCCQRVKCVLSVLLSIQHWAVQDIPPLWGQISSQTSRSTVNAVHKQRLKAGQLWFNTMTCVRRQLCCTHTHIQYAHARISSLWWGVL